MQDQGKPCPPPPPPRDKPPKTPPSPFSSCTSFTTISLDWLGVAPKTTQTHPKLSLVTAETGSSLSVASRGGQGFSFELAWPQARCLTSSLLS
ncbi:hypothetical protein P168DRAFT_292567 [Aspergillus campestris IBT 28561]|uniref:Uncharacterized protein n=1 Tax=Aspergillus campestris (strain IBT 28561) TaxID=1392248 RepID=A0A2I1CV29_ASPC2|nr:uncharacterized protein P168DRAFT_292567 [Aspergillus campestris IBT 28561]PKY01465.1 hypothetical protein P168DRAFT_292567 [Aspergillus campestris IBT 28561]